MKPAETATSSTTHQSSIMERIDVHALRNGSRRSWRNGGPTIEAKDVIGSVDFVALISNPLPAIPVAKGAVNWIQEAAPLATK